MALDIRNLSVRTASGIVYAGLLIGCVVLGPVAVAILSSVLAALSSLEIERNTAKNNPGYRWVNIWLLNACTLVFMMFATLALAKPGSSLLPVYIFALLVFSRFLLQIFLKPDFSLRQISNFAFELLYIGVPLALFILAVTFIPDPWIVVCALSMIWISDTGAYIVGSLFGRHKLSPVLSPNKSWEGFFGGLLFNIGAAFIFFYCFHLDQYLFLSNVQGWIYIGICVTAFSTLGDLFESMLKRSMGIKDFSHIIPGHGGVLDRIDSLLCVIPCLLLAVELGKLMFV